MDMNTDTNRRCAIKKKMYASFFFFFFRKGLPGRFTGRLVETRGVNRNWDPTGCNEKVFTVLSDMKLSGQRKTAFIHMSWGSGIARVWHAAISTSRPSSIVSQSFQGREKKKSSSSLGHTHFRFNCIQIGIFRALNTCITPNTYAPVDAFHVRIVICMEIFIYITCTHTRREHSPWRVICWALNVSHIELTLTMMCWRELYDYHP